MAKFKDIMGLKFGEWTPIRYLGNCIWECKCSCGNIGQVRGNDLRSGRSKRCKNHERLGLVGTTRGNWCVESKVDEDTYDCKCILCNKHRLLNKRQLDIKYGAICECSSKRDKLDDLSGKQFGYLLVEEYLGNKQYRCKCLACNKGYKIVRRQHLIKGDIRSCGCKASELMLETIMDKFGETNISKIKNPREEWQIDIVENRDKLKEFIEEHSDSDNKIRINRLCELLNLNRSNMWLKIHEYDLESYIKTTGSEIEKDILAYIKSYYTGEIITNTKKIIPPLEIDIYIPELKIAFEVNGVYWHSIKCKDKYYHQRKTMLCNEKGIRLIHIFDYEWEYYNNQITRLIQNVLEDKQEVTDIETLEICEILEDDALKFKEENSTRIDKTLGINLGAYINNELVELITFSKINDKYEILEICEKHNLILGSITNRLFIEFINRYNPISVETSIDISKYNIDKLLKLGFKIKEITEPEILNNEIESVYNSGKIKLEWRK